MRGVRREHELVVRAALGAGRGRLRRLLLVENLVLALAGAALGLLIAVGGVAAARLARGALLAARERDPARRHGAWLHAGAAHWSSRCCSPSRPSSPGRARSALGGGRA